MLRLHLERISDIAYSRVDSTFEEGAEQHFKSLQGEIRFRNVFFRYNEDDPWIIDDLSFTVSAGEHVAITGPSGCGKSTILKLLVGLLHPQIGEILVDGVPLVEFGARNLREQAGIVLQDDHVFTGDIEENVTMFDTDTDASRLEQALEQAALMDDLAEMPMGSRTPVGDMGSSLSGGQKQRLLLARALYRKPKILVIDEGTSHLDKAREQKINGFISRLGLTRIQVAHRAETLRAADRVLSFDGRSMIDITER